MNTPIKILIVDDEPDVLEILQYNLNKEGYEVHTASNGSEAIEKAQKLLPDLILLDVMMPNMDGIQACEHIREIPELQSVLVAFLTARSEDYSEIAGLNAGADDYIVKPIRPKVLIARIQSLLKRKETKTEKKNEENKKIIFQNIEMDLEKRLVLFNKEMLTLPKKEFKLLKLLLSNPERVFTREEIYNTVWGSDIVVGDRTIDVHIRKLREKLNESYIETIKGVGYSLVKRS
ncbi:MAG: response regulator transcription factor [Bacteroidales bacterium]|jgi:two-component system alkaline phosphatase synthesis response regulator PhoP|nr:response regulator transcription factor [Bacteroidales bacterium]